MSSAKIFISYSSKDEDEVNELLHVLEREKLPYWKAPEMIPIGSNYAKEIPKMISSCSIFLVLVSNYSMDSIWVEKELDYAINQRKKIVPIQISGKNLSDMFKFYLNNVQMIYYSDGKRKAQDKLVGILKGIIASEERAEKEAKEQKLREERLKGKDIKFEVEKSKAIENDIKIKEQQEKDRQKRRVNDPSFGLNPQPEACRYCGGMLQTLAYGVYKCMKCRKENYDYFHLVRNYLEDMGPSTRAEIEEATGVPRASIEYFFKQEKLEVQKSSALSWHCKRCGRIIRSGSYCDHCKPYSYLL